MSSTTRKKSIVSSTGVDQPVANNTLLNKAAAQSTSLYRECSTLRARLARVVNFSQYFTLASSEDQRQSRDPVTQIWDVFTLGISLVYLWNLLPGSDPKIGLDTSIVNFDKSRDKQKKRGIIEFSIRMNNFANAQPFTVTDLWDRNSTDGLVKVVHNVGLVVDKLPPEFFEAEPVTPSSSLPSQVSTDTLVDPSIPASPDAKEAARNFIIREMIETERKYVQDLEVMQKYAVALSQSNQVDQDTIHYLFPNLNKLLNFQRQFLIRMESIGDLPWPEQRWGSLFSQSEEEFIVYEPYCAHYTKATELMLNIETILMDLSQSIGMTAMKGELPAFLIKPIQRVCKYPLLIESLVKAANPADYPHYDELESGLISAKRIADRINEAQRRSENEMTVKSLQSRVEDWKGHHLSNFGELLLDDIFIVTKSDVDREYHVFLFEKIILCCKEAIPALNSSKKVSKSNSILKKQQMAAMTSPPLGGAGAANKKTSPLLLKGRIFLNNVTKAVPSNPTGTPLHYPLAVWWRGDDDLEFFTLRCHTLESQKKWETQITRLIEEAAKRRTSDLRSNSISKIATTMNSTNPSLGRQMASHERTHSQSGYMSPIRSGRRTPFGEDLVSTVSNSTTSSFHRGPSNYPPSDAYDHDEEDYEDYPAGSSYAESGRGTPIGSRRNNALSMPPEREHHPVYDRSRAQTEDTNGVVMSQWRNHQAAMPPPPPPAAGYTSRPTTPRLHSTMSNGSHGTDASTRRPALRSQFSSTRLKSTYDANDARSQPMPTNGPSRSRSASQPSAYVPKSIPPPLPTTNWPGRPDTSLSTNKRGSGSSESTGDSSDYSPNSSSPITPFGASDVSLGGGVGIRSSRSQHFDGNNSHLHYSPPVKVKVHFHEDIFVIQVPRTMEFDDLVDRVGRKIRLCGPRRDDGPLRVKYRDEDGDMISLGSTEDVQMAFEQFRPGGQVTLFVS